MSNELTDVRCPCGAEFQADSYDAGFIAGSGMCQNCDAALPPKDICTCPSGDGSLSHPCPAHPAVEQAGGDRWDALQSIMEWTAAENIPDDRKLCLIRNAARAALAQPSQSQYEASFEEWLANELEGEDGHPVPAAVCDIALARRAFNHWPKLEQPAKVGGVRFSAGVSSRLVVEAAQRLYEFESTPEKEAERIEQLQAFREQLDPLNLAPHAEAFNEAPDEALRPEQAEAERPEGPTEDELEAAGLGYPLHKEEAVKLWYSGFRSEVITVLEAWEAIGHDIGMNPDKGELLDSLRYMLEKCEAHDAALARVAELERQQPVAWMHDQPNRVDVIHRDVKDLLQRVPGSSRGIYRPLDVSEHYTIPLYAAPVAQAQHSVPDGVTVNPEALRQVVRALVGPAHHIRELQVTASLPGSPITELVKQYNAWAAGAPGKEGA
ncbi:hypothetical protein [Pseudomonas aeruginosa]|uniref:hypothetical protein n=1 Tax=Pseudomonas aeruginosa TaxID=287 RepID=UPI000AA425F8|nr:hypothetical protein [Pseudomonas aeruginosa]MBA5114443.1 hypothetical protein [Pseudomonas aeruginosa]